MKTLLLSFSLFFSYSLLAQEVPQDIEFAETAEEVSEEQIRIKDVRKFLETHDKDTTCLDEYLKRRNQLIGKMVLAPVTVTAAATGGFVIGAFAGSGVAYVTGADALVSLAWGLVIGSPAGAAAGLTDSGLSIVEFRERDTFIKALGEHYLKKPGKKSDKLYQSYLKKNPDAVSKDEFFKRLLDLDQSGKLCDGSLVKQPRIKLGFKLKYKLARTKNLRTHL